LSTEHASVGWIRRFILFHNKRHPLRMGAAKVSAFVTHLAVDGPVAASTQNQALSAPTILFAPATKTVHPSTMINRQQDPEPRKLLPHWDRLRGDRKNNFPNGMSNRTDLASSHSRFVASSARSCILAGLPWQLLDRFTLQGLWMLGLG
jgi:hypothetical protein